MLRLLRRRDAAVAEHMKVEEQLRKAKDKTMQEDALRQAVQAQTDAQLKMARSIGERLKLELMRIQQQAEQLRDLRNQLKDPSKKPHPKPSQGLPPTEAATSHCSE